MYDIYDEEYKKQLKEIFGDGYGDDPEIEWETEEMQYRELLELERMCFKERRGCGMDAHAYNRDIDNIVIMQLREEGKTLREIAELFDCSPSTIRNRLKILEKKRYNDAKWQLT